jgi:hypothetical protein
MNENLYNCPSCGSGSRCKLSVIYRNGAFSSKGDLSRYGDFLGINDVRVNIASKSKASQAASPPPNPFQVLFYWILLEVSAFITWTIIATILQGITRQVIERYFQIPMPIFLGVHILLASFITFICFKAIIDYPADKARWNKTYHCQRCDYLFLV